MVSLVEVVGTIPDCLVLFYACCWSLCLKEDIETKYSCYSTQRDFACNSVSTSREHRGDFGTPDVVVSFGRGLGQIPSHTLGTECPEKGHWQHELP